MARTHLCSVSLRTVAGRLEMRYRYSGSIVYNNFPWVNAADEQKRKIEITAQRPAKQQFLEMPCIRN